MNRGAIIVGVALASIGGYFWWWSIQITYVDGFDDWFLWVVTFFVGSILVTFGPCVIVDAYTKSNQTSFREIVKQKQWQVIQMPLECSECGNAISIRSLEWISDEEVRCPFCSKDLEIRMSEPNR